MKKLLVLLPLMISCGVDNQGLNQAADTLASNQGVEYQPNEKEVVIEFVKDGESVSTAVADTKALPACSNAYSGQSAYVKETKSFFLCRDGVWKEQAAKATEAPIVERATASEVAAIVPAAAELIMPNEWEDPSNGKRWFIAGLQSQSQMLSFNSCKGDGWRMPTITEINDAYSHGFGMFSESINGPTAMWTSDNKTCTDLPGEMCHAFVTSSGRISDFRDLIPALTGTACIHR